MSIVLFVLYVAATLALAIRGARKTAGFASFAAGSTDTGVLATALVCAACLTSTATFSINPGFVYREGLAALLGFSLPVAVGVTLAFAILGPRLRETAVGPDGKLRVLTLPQWIGERFASGRLRTLFALLGLALFSYAVLVLAGGAYVASAVLGAPPAACAAGIIALVVVYTVIGGTHAHVSTNVAKGVLLLLAAATLGGMAAFKLATRGLAAEPGFLAPWREGSKLFSGPLDVFVWPLVVGFALACQPHLLVKALYVRDAARVRQVGFVAGALFLLLGTPALLVGLAARAELGAEVAQDRAVATWIAAAFPEAVAAILAVIMVAAAVGTLNALLLALGTVVANDVVRTRTRGLLWSRGATIAIGAAAWACVVNPPRLVWVVGVLGVYALVAAACPAVVAGCLRRRPAAGWVGAAAVLGPLAHGLAYGLGLSANPNATGALGIAVGFTVIGIGTAAARLAARVPSDRPALERVGSTS